jgi:hypothetical protein
VTLDDVRSTASALLGGPLALAVIGPYEGDHSLSVA